MPKFQFDVFTFFTSFQVRNRNKWYLIFKLEHLFIEIRYQIGHHHTNFHTRCSKKYPFENQEYIVQFDLLQIENISLIDLEIVFFLPCSCLMLLVLVRAQQKNDFEVRENKHCSEFLTPVKVSGALDCVLYSSKTYIVQY